MFKIYNLKEGIKTTNKIINDIMFLYDFRSKKLISQGWDEAK